MGLFKTCKDVLKHKVTKATFVRPQHSGQFNNIEVTLPDGEVMNFYEGSVRQGAKNLSPNERKKVIEDCEKQIDGLKDGNCPTIFREMLSELKYGKFEDEK